MLRRLFAITEIPTPFEGNLREYFSAPKALTQVPKAQKPLGGSGNMPPEEILQNFSFSHVVRISCILT